MIKRDTKSHVNFCLQQFWHKKIFCQLRLSNDQSNDLHSSCRDINIHIYTYTYNYIYLCYMCEKTWWESHSICGVRFLCFHNAYYRFGICNIYCILFFAALKFFYTLIFFSYNNFSLSSFYYIGMYVHTYVLNILQSAVHGCICIAHNGTQLSTPT